MRRSFSSAAHLIADNQATPKRTTSRLQSNKRKPSTPILPFAQPTVPLTPTSSTPPRPRPPRPRTTRKGHQAHRLRPLVKGAESGRAGARIPHRNAAGRAPTHPVAGWDFRMGFGWVQDVRQKRRFAWETEVFGPLLLVAQWSSQQTATNRGQASLRLGYAAMTGFGSTEAALTERTLLARRPALAQRCHLRVMLSSPTARSTKPNKSATAASVAGASQ